MLTRASIAQISIEISLPRRPPHDIVGPHPLSRSDNKHTLSLIVPCVVTPPCKVGRRGLLYCSMQRQSYIPSTGMADLGSGGPPPLPPGLVESDRPHQTNGHVMTSCTRSQHSSPSIYQSLTSYKCLYNGQTVRRLTNARRMRTIVVNTLHMC